MRARSVEELNVVMPVHNALPHLDAAVRSILDQSYRDFSFVIYDDASTDGSTERLREWARQDSRILLFEGARNLGPARSSNAVVEKATGRLIARMDADDISHPERLRRELELLQSDPNVGLVGSLCDIIDANGRRIRGPEFWRLTRKSWFAPFPHGSIMYRRGLFERVGGYRTECEFWEDHDLVLRLAAETQILVIPEAMYQHRQSISSTRVASNRERVENAVDLMYRSVALLDEGRGYDALLQARPPLSRRVDPRVFIAGGSIRLWAGGRPRLLGRLLRRGRLRLDWRSVSALVWTAWASTSPSTLRAFLRILLANKNRLAAESAKVPGPVTWSPPVIREAAGPPE